MSESRRVRCLTDTNVWLYAFIETQDQRKSALARDVIRDNEIIVSVQVINEVCINLIKKAQFNEAKIQQLIASFFLRHHVIETGREVLLAASGLRSRYGFSFWDSMIVAGALVGNATIVYSEDMADDLLVDNRLRILNPFRSLAQDLTR